MSEPLLIGFKWARVAAIVAALMAAAIVMGLFAGSEMVIGLGTAALMIALIVAFASSLSSLRARPMLRRMIAGDHYAHWQYSGAEWERHLAAEKKRGISVTFLMLIFVGLIFLGVLLMIWIETKYRASVGLAARDLAYWLRWMIPLSIPTGVLLLVGVVADQVERWQRERLRREGGRVYVGREGIYWCGEFWPSARSPLLFCEQVQLEAGDPANLVFRFRMLHLRHSPASTTTQNSYRVIHVPVPSGRDEQAHAVLNQVQRDWFGRYPQPG